MSGNFSQREYYEMRARALANLAPAINVRSVAPRAPKRLWNKTEEAFSRILDTRLHVGEIRDWWFEALTFKLGRDCRYTPDFAVIHADGSLHLYEVKGKFCRDDARAKFRAAATMFPYFGWWWAQRKFGAWDIQQEPQALRSGGPS